MKLQDLLRHIADNVENGLDWYADLVCEKLNNQPTWSDVVDHHDWFELAPRTHEVNGFTVPAPESEALNVGDKYYSAVPTRSNWCFPEEWGNSMIDNRYLTRGIIHLTKEAAIANAKAMLGINPNK